VCGAGAAVGFKKIYHSKEREREREKKVILTKQLGL
jgi:ribosomal protein S24E